MFIIPVLTVIIIFIVVIWVLIILNKRIHQKVESEKKKFLPFRKKLKKLKPNAKDFESFNKLARDFFKERFSMNFNLTYSELAETFKEKNQDDIVEFCNLMTHLIYSGEKTNSDMSRAMKMFSNILKEYG